MERETDKISVEEESTPFLHLSSQRKYEVRSHQRRALLTYCLIALLSVSLCFHVLTFLYIKSASYLDAICILHTQQSRMFSSPSLAIHFGWPFLSHYYQYTNSLPYSSLWRNISCQFNNYLPPPSLPSCGRCMGRSWYHLPTSSPGSIRG